MTPFERNHPKQINGSRRARIAAGSGVSVTEVNELLTRFREAQKMMKALAKGGSIPGMPGMPGLPGAGKRGRPAPQRRKGKSGNPAKRAEQERSAAAAAAGRAPAGSAFGVGALGTTDPYASLDPSKLPKGFEKFLGR